MSAEQHYRLWRQARTGYIVRVLMLLILIQTGAIDPWWLFPPRAAAALVQSGGELSVTGGTNGNSTFGSGTTAGNAIIVVAFGLQSVTATFSATDGTNSFTVAVWNALTAVGSSAILYLPNCQAGLTSISITSSSSQNFRARAFEYSGLATSSLLETFDSLDEADTTSHVCSAAGITTSVPCMIFAAACASASMGTITPSGSYNGITFSSARIHAQWWDPGTTVSGEQAAYGGTTSRPCAATIAAFKLASGGGGFKSAFARGSNIIIHPGTF